jgi:short-subunit dehydrogenase
VADRGWALVTGASSGIGLEIARVLAARGYDLVLSARNEGALENLAAELATQRGTTAIVIVADLALAGAAAELHRRIAQAGMPIEILVNNAGFATYGPFADADPEVEREELNVNIVALTELTKLFLTGMLARRRGRILNVASTAAFQAGPLMAIYHASKSYVLHFSEALAEEVRGSGVTVTAVCPGYTATGFQRRTRIANSKLFESSSLSAQAVAEIAVDAMFRGRTLVVPGITNAAIAWLVRFFPRRAVAHFIRRSRERPRVQPYEM